MTFAWLPFFLGRNVTEKILKISNLKCQSSKLYVPTLASVLPWIPLEPIRSRNTIVSYTSSKRDSTLRMACLILLGKVPLFPSYDVLHTFHLNRNDCYLGVACNFTDWEYEMASVLYNAGAHHSMLGSRERRESSEEMKVACTHFQCAAWVFHTLPDRYPKQMGSDLSVDVLAFLSQARIYHRMYDELSNQ